MKQHDTLSPIVTKNSFGFTMEPIIVSTIKKYIITSGIPITSTKVPSTLKQDYLLLVIRLLAIAKKLSVLASSY